ncbi:MAG: hypothetical protein F6J87_28120, partial [Spirulina sp. SIO3F2]|nr:hypothetical protein [Spirulina sp. SIO3F2]
MTSQRHIIKRQILDLQVSSEMGALELQNQVSAIYRNKLLPLIEAYCDRLSSPDQIHRIDRLVIDLGEIELAHLDTDLVQKLEAALVQELANQIPASTPSPNKPSPSTAQSEPAPQSPTAESEKSRSPEPAVEQTPHTPHTPNPPSAQPQPIAPLDADLELLCLFLQTGRLPWWSEPFTPKQLEAKVLQLLQTAPQRASTLLQTHLRSPQGRQRLLYQFSEPLWQEVLNRFAPSWSTAVTRYSADLQTLIPHISELQTWTLQHFKLMVWQGIFLHLSLEMPPQSSPEVALTNNLLHLATQANVEPAILIAQLRQAIATLRQTQPLPQASLLPKILAKWPTTPPPSASKASAIADIQPTTEQDMVAMPDSSISKPISPEFEPATSALDDVQGAIADIEIIPGSPITAPQPLTPEKTYLDEEEQNRIAEIQEAGRDRGASISPDSMASPSPELVADSLAEIEPPSPQTPAERLTPLNVAPTPTAIPAQSQSAIADSSLSQTQRSSASTPA